MHSRWQNTALSGEGAALYPGGWNERGERLVYLADSLALALLETRVHLEVQAASEPYVAIEFSLPEESVADVGQLEEGWQLDLAYTRALGSEWLASGSSLALRVPSATLLAGANLLLDPKHEAARRVRELRRLPLEWDAWLF